MESTTNNKSKWYAVYTRSRAEKKVLKNLQEIGIEAYLPLIKTLRQWSDRKKMVEVPLFPSNIFVKIRDNDYRKVLETEGAVAFITFERKKVAIPDKQIIAMRTMVETGMDVEATTDHLRKGDVVRVGSGPLRGVKGEVIEINGKQRFVLRIDIGYTLVVALQGVELIKV
jgi:transcriptional antiterminator RfaH